MNRSIEILRDAFRHGGYRLWLVVILMPIVGISDGIAMVMLYPLVAMVGAGTPLQADNGTLGQAFRWLMDQIGVEPTLFAISSLVIAAFLVQSVLFVVQNWLLIHTQKKYIAQWQRRMFSDFIDSEWLYFLQLRQGSMVNFVLNECYRLGAAFISVLQLITVAFVAGVYFVISLALSWQLTLFLILAGIMLVLLVRPIRVATRRNGEEYGRLNAEFIAAFNEMLGGVKLIKSTAAESHAKRIIAEHTERIRRNLFWGAFLPTNLRLGFEFAAILMILGGLVYGLTVDRTVTPQILMLMALVARLFPRLLQWQQLQNTLNLTAPAYDILVAADREFESHRESLRFGGSVPGDDGASLDISVRSLSIRYGEKTILDNVSLDIPAGHVLGLVGASGAGKSTLIDAVLGLVPPSAGEIVVAGVSLRDANLAAWRGKIGYVAQETFLFHDTIANNIRWSMPDAPMSAVEDAAKAAGLHDFVKSLSAGYDTVVGDRGARISGGQRQRISIAHALIRKPALLVLDEATSALDSLSEKDIMAVINGLRGRMTVLIVAHRLSIVREADQICVLDHGKIAEQGTWSALSRRKALFHRLMQAQTISGEH